MKRRPACAIALLASAALLACGGARAQARGPSAKEILAEGQYVGSGNVRDTVATRRVWGWKDIPLGELVPDVEFSALGAPGLLDAATRAAQRAQLETWLRRLPGRFRIEGRVETPGSVTVQAVGADNNMADTSIATVLAGKVSGVADCAAIGDGVGLHCIINATWPSIDLDIAAIGSRPTISDALNTLTPGMLDLGMNLDPPGVRAQLVTNDSIAHVWAGTLMGDTLRADRLTECKAPTLDTTDPPEYRCLQPLEIMAAPDSEIVTIILRTPVPEAPPWAPQLEIPLPHLTITLTMHRDPEANAEMLKKKKKEKKKSR